MFAEIKKISSNKNLYDLINPAQRKEHYYRVEDRVPKVPLLTTGTWSSAVLPNYLYLQFKLEIRLRRMQHRRNWHENVIKENWGG